MKIILSSVYGCESCSNISDPTFTFEVQAQFMKEPRKFTLCIQCVAALNVKIDEYQAKRQDRIKLSGEMKVIPIATQVQIINQPVHPFAYGEAAFQAGTERNHYADKGFLQEYGETAEAMVDWYSGWDAAHLVSGTANEPIQCDTCKRVFDTEHIHTLEDFPNDPDPIHMCDGCYERL